MFKIYFALLCFQFLYEEAESENRIEGTMTTTKTEKKKGRGERRKHHAGLEGRTRRRGQRRVTGE